MRLPYSWLKEFLPIALAPEEVGQVLTMAGLEVDGIEGLGNHLQQILVAKVVKAEKHPNADKLSVTTVFDGTQEHQVVCGAPNCRTGLLTAFAPVGTILGTPEDPWIIKKTKIRGVESCGMLCSEKELDISEEQEGIMELPSSLACGTTLHASSLYHDPVFEISLTPNLGHCNSVWGIARELSALLSLPLKRPMLSFNECDEVIDSWITVSVQDTHNCPRYACRILKNVAVSESPLWLRKRLEQCGVRPVNNVVDAVAYMQIAYGHPMHAFDDQTIQGKTLVVRPSKLGERLTTLDDQERILPEGTLVIADSEQPLAIAGIMGSKHSAVSEQTRNVLLEAAYFDPVMIRKTSQTLHLKTDASFRFERGVDPERFIELLARTAALIQQVAGGEIVTGAVDRLCATMPEKIVRCRLSKINALLGTQFGRGEIFDLFQRLQLHPSWDGEDTFLVRVPSYRHDLCEEVDCIEEVARLYGYNRFEKPQPSFSLSTTSDSPLFLFERQIRTLLLREGLQECLTCDLIGPALLVKTEGEGWDNTQKVHVLNPTSVDQSVLRTSLLPGLLETVRHNFDHQQFSLALFEIGRVHFRTEKGFQEPTVVAFALTGPAQPETWCQKPAHFDFFDAKGIVENLLAALGIHGASYQNLSIDSLHTGRQASVFVGARELGSFGELHPAVSRRFDFSQRVYFGEFDLEALAAFLPHESVPSPLPAYPGSSRDWTFTARSALQFGQIQKALQQLTSPLLSAVLLKGIYTSEKLGADRQNLTLHFAYRDAQKTAVQEEVDQEHARVLSFLQKTLRDFIIESP